VVVVKTVKWYAACVLTLEQSHCDVIVRAVAQMPDLFTSHALLNMQKQKVCRLWK
jgi:hypothetical protein